MLFLQCVLYSLSSSLGAPFPIDILPVTPSVSSFCPLDFHEKFMKTESLRFLQWLKAFNSSLRSFRKVWSLEWLKVEMWWKRGWGRHERQPSDPSGASCWTAFKGIQQSQKAGCACCPQSLQSCQRTNQGRCWIWDAGQPRGRWAEVLVTVWCRVSSGCPFHVFIMSFPFYSWPAGKFPSRLLPWFQNAEGDKLAWIHLFNPHNWGQMLPSVLSFFLPGDKSKVMLHSSVNQGL